MTETRHRNSKRSWGWLVLGLVFLGILVVPLPDSYAAPQERHFRVEANSFEYTPATLYANPGDRVTIDLISKDVVHGIYIDGYDLEVSADPGQTERLTFIASRPGSFRLRCSVTCGALHPFMIGKLSVGVNWTLWKGLGLAILAAVAGVWSLHP